MNSPYSLLGKLLCVIVICCRGGSVRYPIALLAERAAQVDTEAERELKLPGSETAEHGSTVNTWPSNMPEKAFKA